MQYARSYRDFWTKLIIHQECGTYESCYIFTAVLAPNWNCMLIFCDISLGCFLLSENYRNELSHWTNNDTRQRKLKLTLILCRKYTRDAPQQIYTLWPIHNFTYRFMCFCQGFKLTYQILLHAQYTRHRCVISCLGFC